MPDPPIPWYNQYMTGTPQKCVVKGRITSVGEFRLVFYGAKSDNAVSDQVMWTGYLDNFFATGFLAHWRNYVTLYAFEVYEWDGAEWQPKGEFAYSKVGTSATGDTLPYQNAAVLVGKTSKKRTFGRKFIPAILENDQTDSLLGSPMMTVLTTLAAAYLAVFTSGATSLTPAVWSKTLQLIPFTGAVVDNIIGSQRRRKPNVGI